MLPRVQKESGRVQEIGKRTSRISVVRFFSFLFIFFLTFHTIFRFFGLNIFFPRKRHRTDIIRQTFPRTRGDFDKLYNLIERWRAARVEIAKNQLFCGARKAESCRILEKMTDMLKSLEKHRRFAYLEKHENKRILFLAKHCKPITWHGYKAKKVEMVTLRIQKAREYKNIYENLMSSDKNVEERIELLILLKNSLANHSCIPVDHFIYLVDQEIALISHGVDNKWLDYLRQRISSKQ